MFLHTACRLVPIELRVQGEPHHGQRRRLLVWNPTGIPTMSKEPYVWLRLYAREGGLRNKSFKMAEGRPVDQRLISACAPCGGCWIMRAEDGKRSAESNSRALVFLCAGLVPPPAGIRATS